MVLNNLKTLGDRGEEHFLKNLTTVGSGERVTVLDNLKT